MTKFSKFTAARGSTRGAVVITSFSKASYNFSKSKAIINFLYAARTEMRHLNKKWLLGPLKVKIVKNVIKINFTIVKCKMLM